MPGGRKMNGSTSARGEPDLSAVFVGFGFGAIQAGLFVYEAFRTRLFNRLVVVEVVPQLVESVRKNSGYYHVNIAHPDGIETVNVGPVEIYNPGIEVDRRPLISAIAEASEISTAVPSVSFYESEDPGSIHRLLSRGLLEKLAAGGPPALVYAAENHNHAAEILEERVFSLLPRGARPAVRTRVRFINTVIGKMSGVITNSAEMAGLAPVTSDCDRAFLVEEFNRILISQVTQDDRNFTRRITAFEEKADLLPFEEAKLYGHNATHALGAYLAMLRGIVRIAELRNHSEVLDLMRSAFIEESGGALIRKYWGIDPLFTPEGYAWYADDLLRRMTNPHLRDTAERVGRDPRRKLGWDDRLIGTMRLAFGQGIRPWRYALGAAAALACLFPESRSDPGANIGPLLDHLWDEAPAAEKAQVIAEILKAWPALDQFVKGEAL
jgi:mannitol-1-phosphate 5-dehydrogenase